MSSQAGAHEPVYTIGVGGAAGDGVREAGVHFGAFAERIGCHAFLAFYYPSLIRGGHNYGRVSFSAAPVHADYAPLDILVALNADSVRIRKPELKDGGIVIVESKYFDEARAFAPEAHALPMSDFAEQSGAPRAAQSSAAIGAMAYMVGIEREEFTRLTETIFNDLVGGRDLNTQVALRGYDHARDFGFPVREEMRSQKCVGCVGSLVEGNKAVAKGFLSAGLRFYVGYPMTPSTSILHFFAKEAVKGQIAVIHPEDEIAVINAALGIAYAGKRVAIGTATGGFALMQEAFSFAGVSELPIAIAVSQRMGPATGVATHTGQSDLRFVIHAGHGEFPRLVIAPGDVDECYQAGVAALDLAWKYQIPSIVLLDKHLSESHATSCIVMEEERASEIPKWQPRDGETYKRFTITDSGISPLVFPGHPDAAVKATSYEHDEFGISTDEPEKVVAMQEKRWRKAVGLRGEFANWETVKVTGDSQSDTAILFWGSTKGAVLEATKRLPKMPRLVQIIWMEPMDEGRVKEALSGVTRIIAIEGNHNAQLAGLVREKTGIAATETILKYDSEPFEPTALAEELRRRLS
jgi:2-oxoglutarate ferredoxin oxidoreductase subunit alpha